jgi:uncharacterized protein (TIGR01777 family)
MKVVIPGGSGQVGTILARHFHQQGHSVTVLSRNPRPAPWRMERWDAETEGEWTGVLEQSDVCINLTGRSVDCRYHAMNRREMYNSRIVSARLLNHVIASLKHPPRLWLNASTATIYRHALDRPMDEISGELGGNEPGAPDTWNFSIKIAKDWEAAFFAGQMPATRRIATRSSVTFSADRGGVFDVLSKLVRTGLGGRQGSGAQYVSWIHEVDFVRAVEFLIAREALAGPVNICSPNPVINKEFLQAFRAAWRQPIGLPAPAWIIEIGTFLLRTESELVLKSRRVIPAKLLDAGFTFTFQNWPLAAQDLVTRYKLNQHGCDTGILPRNKSA